MKYNFKFFSLILWVTQFGLSVLFPICALLILGVWLQQKFDWSMWSLLFFGALGLLISVSTAKTCIRSLKRDAEDVSDQKKPPVAFNDHN